MATHSFRTNRLRDRTGRAIGEIGVYWIRSSGPAIRSLLMKAGSSAHGARVYVEEGSTYADVLFRCTNDRGSAVVGTNTLSFESAGCCTAAQTTYSPSGTGDWPGTSDPDDVADALDKLAGRVTVVESSPGVSDAADVTYTPGTASDWSGTADPGDVDDALDQLASRLKTVETTGGGGNSFETIAVSGQSNVVADSSTDTLTLVAGTNITITTNATTDTITIAASGGTGESWHPFLLAGI